MKIDEHINQFVALLPPGYLWQSLTQPGTLFMDLVGALMEEHARIDDNADSLLEEADPRTTTTLIGGWEAYVGSPLPCFSPLTELIDRRNSIAGQLASVGGNSLQYYIDLASALGFTITINDGITPHHWEILIPGVEPTRLSVGQGVGHQVGDPLRTYGSEKLLECLIMRDKQAQTVPTFTYGATANYSITRRDTDA